MNTVSIIVALILVAVIICAAYGSYKNFHEEKCCGGDRNCTCGETKHCSLRKED
jgi:hypothetical protein